MSRIVDRLKDSEPVKVISDNADKIELLPVSSLKLSKNRVRRSVNREDIVLMAKGVKNFGILQPLEVNERNEVVLGNRRLEAAKLACLDRVPVIRRDGGELNEVEKQLVSDLHSKNIGVWERAEAFEKLIELKNMTKYALARYLGLSDNLICRTLAILSASAETKRLMKEGKISQRIVAAVLYRLKDKSKEKYVVDKIIKEKMSVAQAENLVAEINDSKLLNKHFLKQVRSFRTSLRRFEEKKDVAGGREEKEIKSALKDIKGIVKKY